VKSEFMARVGLFEVGKPIIGMVHLGALPGSARDEGDLAAVLERAVTDARALAEGGVDALMVENFFDAPFHKSGVPAVTVAAMTAAVLAVRGAVDIPVGVNVLRNDAVAALGIAHATGARFVRCNVFVGAAVTDQGLIEGCAREVMEWRRRLGADVEVWADVEVKHAAQLGGTAIDQQAKDAVERGRADSLIVTGAATGAETPLDRLYTVRAAAPETPVFIGSGLTADSAERLLAVADGAIVGSSLRRDGDVAAPVDVERVRALMEAVSAARPAADHHF
jgi:hypothetical protein